MALPVSTRLQRLCHHLRWGNLLMIVICLGLFRYKLTAIMAMYGQQPVLSSLAFVMLVASMLFLTLGGYWINDYHDLETDALNLKKRSQNALSAASLRMGACFFSLAGLAFALAAAWLMDLMPWLILYPVVGLSLWIYSRWLKGLPLVGNILIAALSGTVPLLLLIPEQQRIMDLPSLARIQIGFVFYGFGLFAFWVSLFREIVKDLEDEAGDRAVGIRTLAVAWGKEPTKIVALMPALIIVAGSIGLGVTRIWPGALHELFFVLAGLMLFLVFQLLHAHEKKDYARISFATKALLILGLFFILLF